jgi:LPS export ABC transporter protein LptC
MHVFRFFGIYSFIFFFILILFFSIFFSPTLTTVLKKKEGLPDFSFEDVRITHIDNENIMWELKAGYATISKDSGRVLLRESEGTIFQEKRPYIVFDSDSASMDLFGSDITMNKAHVEFNFNEAPLFLDAHTVFWNSEREQFKGQKEVVIRTKDIELRGEVLDINIPRKKLSVKKQANARIELK